MKFLKLRVLFGCVQHALNCSDLGYTNRLFKDKDPIHIEWHTKNFNEDKAWNNMLLI